MSTHDSDRDIIDEITVNSQNSSIPVWDRNNSKFVGHYEKNKVLKLLELMQEHDDKVVDIMGLHRFNIMRLSRWVTKMERPTEPIKLYIRRIIQIYEYKPLLEAFRSGLLSCRFATDLSNFVFQQKHSDACAKAIAGEINNTEFRKLIKLNK
jgi:hypothetical protein